MRQPSDPFAVRGEDGASLLNQLGFATVLLPALFVTRFQLSHMLCLPHSEDMHTIAGDDTCLLLVDVGPALAFGLCALLGALGGALFASGRAPLLAGLAGGALACVGGALVPYVLLGQRESYFLLEAVFLWAFGAGPGVLTYKALVERGARPRG